MEFLAAMERTALILVLALALPLAFYGIPYASAVVAQTTYVVEGGPHTIPPHGTFNMNIQCSSPSDSALHFFTGTTTLTTPTTIINNQPPLFAIPLNSAGAIALTGDNPNGFVIGFRNNFEVVGDNVRGWIICQSPITIAGISVPEFGSLYLAIALSAVVYFFLARRNTAAKPVSIRPN